MHISERLPHETGRDYALRMIKYNIITLVLEPGSRVSENELAQEMGLSRTPVREALIELSKVKIVEIYPQRGSSIAKIDFAMIAEAQFMREAIDKAVVERCCNRDMTPFLPTLEANLTMQEYYWKNLDVDKMFSLDNDFHGLLYTAADAAKVFELTRNMSIHYDRVRTISITAVKGLRIAEEHHQILDAILARDTQKAIATVHEHLSRFNAEKEEIRRHYPQYFKD